MFPFISILILVAIVIFLIVALAKSPDRPIRELFSGAETHAVLVINDSTNTFDSVAECLSELPKIDRDFAMELTRQVHFLGIAVVFAGSEKQANHYSLMIRDKNIRAFTCAIPDDFRLFPGT